MNNVTFIYYTNNLTPAKLLLTTLLKAIENAGRFADSLIITSQFKISKSPEIVKLFDSESDPRLEKFVVSGDLFDERSFPFLKTFVVGRSAPSLSSLKKQLVFTLGKVKTEFVVFLEDDIFYPPGFFENIINHFDQNKDIVYYADSVLFSREGFFTMHSHNYLSGYSGKTKFFLDHFSDDGKSRNFEPLLRGYGAKDFFGNDKEGYENYVLVHGEPLLDIKHGLNVAGTHLVAHYVENHPLWGDKKEILKFIEDWSIEKFLKENPLVFVGLDTMTRTKWKPSKSDFLFRLFPDKETILKNVVK